MFAAAEFADEKAYYKGQLGKVVGTAEAKPKARARLDRGARGLRHLQARRAAPHRLHARRGRRHPSRLVHRRALGLCVGADRRLHRLHLHHHRHERSGKAARGRPLVDSRHEPGGRRDAGLARRPAASVCITRSCTATPPTPPGATPAWWCSTSPTAPKPKLISHRDGAPPFGGGTHNCLPLPDRDLLVVLDEAVLDHQEDGVKNIWMFDNRDKSKPSDHRELPAAGRSRLQEQGRPFRPAQHP